MKKSLVYVALFMLLSGCMVNVNTKSYNLTEDTFDKDCPVLAKRVVMLYGSFNNTSARELCKKLIYLNSISDEKITLLLNSPGGDATSLMSIANTIESIDAPVDIVNTGLAASSGALLMQYATGKRLSYSDSFMVIHDVKGGTADLKTKYSGLVEKILKERTSLPKGWLPFKGHEYTLDSKDALKYNLIDEIIEKYEFVN